MNCTDPRKNSKRRVRLTLLIALAVVLLALTYWLSNRSSGPTLAKLPIKPSRPAKPRHLESVSLRSWTPPQEAPVPREVLIGDSWKQRFSTALAAAKGAGTADQGRPPFSLLIMDVFKGSQAEKLGVKPGDHMVRCGGSLILGLQALDLQRRDRDQVIQFWSKDGGLRDVTFAPGRMGVYFQEDWRPDVAHWISPDRNPRWDDFIWVASLSHGNDPELSETALFHAHQQGYRGWILPAIMTILSEAQLRHSEALTHGWIAQNQAPPNMLKWVLAPFYKSAAVMGGSEHALTLIQKHRHFNIPPEEWNYSLPGERRRSLAEEDLLGPSPCALALNGKHPPLPFEGLEPNGQYLARLMVDGGTSPFNFPPSQGMVSFIGPGMTNPSYVIEVDLQATPSKNQQHTPVSRMSLMDIAGGVDEILLKLELHPSGTVTVMAHGHPEVSFADRMNVRAAENIVDLALRGPWCEVRVNGNCAFIGPVPYRRDRKVVLALEAWSVQGGFVRLERRDLGEYGRPLPPKEEPPVVGQAISAIEPPPDTSLAWYHEVLVEGYLKNGSRSPAWDEAAVAALRLAVPYMKNPSDLTFVGELHARAKKAVGAGCDDPLVLAVFEGAHRRVRRHPHDEHTPAFRKALSSGAGANYAPILRCCMLVQACWDHVPYNATRFPGTIDKLTQEALALLPRAAADKSVPSSVLTRLMNDLVQYLPEHGKNPIAAFERVWNAVDLGGPGSAASLAFKGDFYISYAWDARGGGWASSVTPEGWKSFHERLELAAKALEEAWRLDATHPAPPTSMIKVALGQESVRKDIETWFTRALQAEPDNVEAIDNLLWFLMPRWHGSRRALLEFGRRSFTEASRRNLSPAIGLALVRAHHNIVYPGSFGSAEDREEEFIEATYWHQPEVWKDVKAVFDWIFAKYPRSAYCLSLYASYASKCGKWTEAAAAFDALGDSLFFGVFDDCDEAYRLRARAKAETK